MNRFCVRFGSFGVSPFAFQQMLCPFLSFLVLSASLSRYDTSFAIHLTCPGDLCVFTFRHVPLTNFPTIHLKKPPNGYLALFSPRAKRATSSNVHVQNGCKELANGNITLNFTRPKSTTSTQRIMDLMRYV